MFLSRLITSLILVPLVLLMIFYGNPWVLTGVVLLILLIATKECLLLIPLKKLSTKVGFFVLMLLSVWACGAFFPYWLNVGLICWVFIILSILTFPPSQSYWGYPALVGMVCLIVIPLFIQGLVHLYDFPNGKSLLVYLLF